MKKFTHLNWWIISAIIVVVMVINKMPKYILPEINEEIYSIPWFAAKIPYATIRLFFTVLLAYFFIGFKNIVGWKKFSWYFLIFIPILYYLLRPEIIDYSKIGISSSILAVLAILIGVIQEELFSRAILYTHIKTKTNGFVAILLSSIIFGLLHHTFVGDQAFVIDAIIGDAVAPFIIGLVLATVYHFSKSLPLAIILHFIWNIVSMFLMVTE